MIGIKNVSKKYGTFLAVDDISLEINDGEIFGFIGPNGAGKSTTLKMLTGISEVSEGKIFINDLSIEDDPLGVKKTIGFVPDSPDIFLMLRGYEYLNFIATIYRLNKVKIKERIMELAEQFEMADALNDKIGNYSHGMRQKIVVMGALIHDPKTWILDEPMTGLDPQSSHLLKKLMREHADKGNTVLFSTHVLEVAEKLCDRLAIINKGKIIFVGSIEEIQKMRAKDTSLEDFFLELVSNNE